MVRGPLVNSCRSAVGLQAQLLAQTPCTEDASPGACRLAVGGAKPGSRLCHLARWAKRYEGYFNRLLKRLRKNKVIPILQYPVRVIGFPGPRAQARWWCYSVEALVLLRCFWYTTAPTTAQNDNAQRRRPATMQDTRHPVHGAAKFPWVIQIYGRLEEVDAGSISWSSRALVGRAPPTGTASVMMS